MVKTLKRRESALDIYLAGGVLAGQLLPEIDELVMKRYHVVAGASKKAFGPHFTPQLLRCRHRFEPISPLNGPRVRLQILPCRNAPAYAFRTFGGLRPWLRQR